MNDKSKLFAFRPGALLLGKLEHVRAVLGLSPSEAARQAMGMGLEKIIQERTDAPDENMVRQMQCNVRGSLLTLIRKWQVGSELTRPEWGFMAHMCNQTYDTFYHHIDVIDRQLIVANLRSFAAVIALRDKQYPDLVKSRADGYYFGNMGFSWVDRQVIGDDLQAYVDASVEGIPAQPSVGTALFSSRNFDCALRDEPPLDIGLLNTALRPYLKSMLLVCLRGYWHEHKTPIITPKDKLDGWRKTEEEQSMSNFIVLKPVSNEHFSFSPHAEETTLSGAIEAHHHPFLFALNNYVELTGFCEMIEMVGQQNKHVKIPGFELHTIGEEGSQKGVSYMMTTGRWQHFFSNEEFNALKTLLRNFVEEPSAAAHLASLEMIYGRI